MAFGKGQNASIQQSKLQDENNRRSWIFVIFFFFWTASSSMLLPWLPVILRVAGLSFQASGAVMFFLIIATIISVKVTQAVLSYTKKGYLRRLFLFTIMVISVVFQVVPITVLPGTGDQALCSSENKSFSNYVSQVIASSGLLKTSTTGDVTNWLILNSTSPALNTSILNEVTTSTTVRLIKTETTFNFETTSTATTSTTTETTTTTQEVKKESTTVNVDTPSENIDKDLDTTTANNTQTLNTLPESSFTDNRESLPFVSQHNFHSNYPYHTNYISYNDVDTTINDKYSKSGENQQDNTKNNRKHKHHLHYNRDANNKIKNNQIETEDKYSKALSRFSEENNKYKAALRKLQDPNILAQLIDNDSLKNANLNPKTLNYITRLLNKHNSKNKHLKHRKRVKRDTESKLQNSNTLLENEEETEKNNKTKIDKTPSLNIIYKSSSHAYWSVSVMFILGILLGGGIEASVSKLWHCISHGYQHIGSLQDDILDRTISSTFHLSTYGKHKGWSSVTSAFWVAMASMLVGLMCVSGIGIDYPYTALASSQVLTAGFALLSLLILPVPSGTLDPPRTKRPLSLYLDDEVLREGIRRLSFHLWVFSMAIVTTLGNIYKVWLLQELAGESKEFGPQAFAVCIQLIGEGLTLPSHKWFTNKFDILGMMGLCALLASVQSVICWLTKNVWMISTSFIILGFSEAILWITVKSNALLLATIRDQEREAGISWMGHRLGTAVGAGGWGAIIGSEALGGHAHPLFIITAALGGLIASIVASAALITKSDRKTRRRIYHTLDLYTNDDEDYNDDDSAEEDDWLVKRAKREGISI